MTHDHHLPGLHRRGLLIASGAAGALALTGCAGATDPGTSDAKAEAGTRSAAAG